MQKGYEGAQNLYQNNPLQYTPYQTLANQGGMEQLQGYQQLADQGRGFQQNIAQPTTDAYGQLISGAAGVQNSPAYAGMQQYAQGTAGPQQSLAQIQQAGLSAGNQYANNIAQLSPLAKAYGDQAAGNSNFGLNSLMGTAGGGGPGMQQLAATASGQYLNSNPYSAAAFQSSVADPMVRNYMTAVAPGIDASASASGRYGSGAHGGMVDTSQQNLVRGLGNAANEWGSAQYGRERALQDQAAQQYAAQGTHAGSQYGQLYNQGSGAWHHGGAGGRRSLWRRRQPAICRAFPGRSGGAATGSGAAIWSLWFAGRLSGGPEHCGQRFAAIPQYRQRAIYRRQGSDRGRHRHKVIAATANRDENKRFYGIQQAPYNTQQAYMGNFAGVNPGGTSSQPYYENQGANILSGITGIGSLALKALPFFSDRALKEDIHQVGKVGDLPLHTFRYKGDDTERIGFMADEVEKLDPKAVATMANGYKAVDYNRAMSSALNSFRKR